MLHIGCHLSVSKGYLAMGRTAESIGADTFAFFTRNPRGGSVRPLDAADVSALRALMGADGFAPLVAHAPYTYNLCSAKDRAREFARQSMADDLVRMESFPGARYNFHPGAHVGQGPQAAIGLIADGLVEAMAPGQTCRVLLETMAGKGTEVGRSFQELAAIIGAVGERDAACADRLGVCLDTCHAWDAGYDVVGDLDGVIAEFDRVVGLDRLLAVHVNDSKNPRGSHKDRHERIGLGYIGNPELGGSLEAFGRIVRHPALRDLPFILETPNELPGYAAEISLLRGLAC